MDDQLDQRVRAVFGRLFRVDAARLGDMIRRGQLEGWDSLAHLDLVCELENQFAVTIAPELALEIETLGDAKRVLSELMNND